MTPLLVTPRDWQAVEGFIALWTDAHYAYALAAPDRLLAIELQSGEYPALSPAHPRAAWFERLAHDLNGSIAAGGTDGRPAVGQGRGADGKAPWPEMAALGDGLHRLTAGPVQGVITEPVHLQFTLLGEQVLRLEARHGYAHRGVLALIRGKSARLAARFAARVAGDATVAHALAYARAAEAALGLAPPARAVMLRAVMAELERIANHAGDLAAIAGHLGLAQPQTKLALLREQVCAAAAQCFGHRLMMDMVIPGGVAGDVKTGGPAALLAAAAALEAVLPKAAGAFAAAFGRMAGVGTIAAGAARFAGGVVARAAGWAEDARAQPGYPPYDGMALQVTTQTTGDAAGRVLVRLGELAASAALLRELLGALPDGQIAVAPPAGSGMGLGVAESFRGPVWYWLRIDNGVIADVFIADASAAHWPLLEAAALRGPLTAYGLIAATINPSCAGVDL